MSAAASDAVSAGAQNDVVDKRQQCLDLIKSIDDELVYYKHQDDFKDLETKIEDIGKYLVAFDELFKKSPHQASLKNLIANLVEESESGIEAFHALKTIISESGYKIYQYCCLADVKASLVGSIENVICSYVSLISQIYGAKAAADTYASFSIPKAPTKCYTCPTIQKKIAQEQVRFNMLLSQNVIKNHLTVTPEDELKVKKELQQQREQEENEDFSEVSDFSCLSHLSDDSAFLTESKYKSVLKQQAEQKAAAASTNLEYTTEHAEIKLPPWQIVSKEQFDAETNDDASFKTEEDNLSDSVYMERHRKLEEDERIVDPEPARKKSKTQGNKPAKKTPLKQEPSGK